MYWYLLSIWPSTYKIHIVLKSVLCTNLYLEEHMRKIAKAVSFLKFNVASNIIVSIGVYRVWVHTCTISYSIESLLNTADVDGGLCTATRTLKCPPPSTPSLTQLHSDLNFWIQKVKNFDNLTSCFSTTSHHPLGTPWVPGNFLFILPHQQNISLLRVLEAYLSSLRRNPSSTKEASSAVQVWWPSAWAILVQVKFSCSS